jgi:hypothetical protein
MFCTHDLKSHKNSPVAYIHIISGHRGHGFEPLLARPGSLATLIARRCSIINRKPRETGQRQFLPRKGKQMNKQEEQMSTTLLPHLPTTYDTYLCTYNFKSVST